MYFNFPLTSRKSSESQAKVLRARFVYNILKFCESRAKRVRAQDFCEAKI